MGKKTTLIRSLREFARQISPDYPVDTMYLFGSRATGNARKDSDVDLLVVSPWFRRKRRLRRAPPLYLRWNLDYSVDFMCLTPEEYRRQKKVIGLVREVVRSGVRII